MSASLPVLQPRRDMHDLTSLPLRPRRTLRRPVTKPRVIRETSVIRNESPSAVLQSVLSAPTTVTRDKSGRARNSTHFEKLRSHWHNCDYGYHSDNRHPPETKKKPGREHDRGLTSFPHNCC